MDNFLGKNMRLTSRSILDVVPNMRERRVQAPCRYGVEKRLAWSH